MAAAVEAVVEAEASASGQANHQIAAEDLASSEAEAQTTYS